MADGSDWLPLTNSDADFRVGARLCNFPTGKSKMLASHRKWLDDNVKDVVQSNAAPYIHLFGYASNLNRHHTDQKKLSNDRLLDTKAYVASFRSNLDFQQEFPIGAEKDGADLNDDGYYRAVEIQVFAKRPKVKPTPTPPDLIKPIDFCSTSNVLGSLRVFLAELVFMFPMVLVISPFLNITLPTFVRRLDGAERAKAELIYGSSLDFERIFITNGVGADARPVTVAFKADGCGWVVALNLGSTGRWDLDTSARPGLPIPSHTLIHELAHAWQSQHHVDRRAYMINSIGSQVTALALEKTTSAAYWYVPGNPFGDYGAEQIAYQAERFYAAGRPSTMAEKAIVDAFSIPIYAVSVENNASLAVARVGRTGTPRLVK